MYRLTSLATAAVLLAGGLLAVPTPAAAQTKKQPGTLHVYDGGSLFTSGGIDRAKNAMAGVRFDHGLHMTIDTHSAPPAGKKVPDEKEKGERAKFFEQWAKEQATGDKAKGVYVLVCRSPGWVQILADKSARDRGFSADDEQHLRDLFLSAFRGAKDKPEAEQFEARDKTLLSAVNYVSGDLKDSVAATVGGPKPAAATPQPVRKAGMSIGGWICLGLCVLLGVWLVVALIRALTAPAYYGGPGYYGGGGFGTAFFGGMFGVMGGMWLYDSMWGTHYHSAAMAGDYGGGYGNSDYGGGNDQVAGEGDFSGDAGAGGGFDDGGGDYGGTGGGDYGGGGDFGGGGDYGGGGDFGGGGGGGDFGGGGGDF